MTSACRHRLRSGKDNRHIAQPTAHCPKPQISGSRARPKQKSAMRKTTSTSGTACRRRVSCRNLAWAACNVNTLQTGENVSKNLCQRPYVVSKSVVFHFFKNTCRYTGDGARYTGLATTKYLTSSVAPTVTLATLLKPATVYTLRSVQKSIAHTPLARARTRAGARREPRTRSCTGPGARSSTPRPARVVDAFLNSVASLYIMVYI